MLQVIVPREESRRQKIVAAGLGTVGAGLGTVGAGLVTSASFLLITEQQNPPCLTDNGTTKPALPHR
ncbi:hypothetical protein [Coleofasciculus chthonoplastes]|uniref:hypothetical protein n=1 Tax=Coleofasciculus chthonoplastes TaxID=64178 RepID=UPI003302E2FB